MASASSGVAGRTRTSGVRVEPGGDAVVGKAQVVFGVPPRGGAREDPVGGAENQVDNHPPEAPAGDIEPFGIHPAPSQSAVDAGDEALIILTPQSPTQAVTNFSP